MRLTKKQKTLLDFVDGFVKGNGYSPTLREIMRALQYKSVSTVAHHIDNLVASGYLTKQDGSVRSLRVTALPSPRQQPSSQLSLCQQLEQEITRREARVSTAAEQQDIALLRQALAIVRTDPQ